MEVWKSFFTSLPTLHILLPRGNPRKQLIYSVLVLYSNHLPKHISKCITPFYINWTILRTMHWNLLWKNLPCPEDLAMHFNQLYSGYAELDYLFSYRRTLECVPIYCYYKTTIKEVLRNTSLSTFTSISTG